jgi:hypothetical protein
VVPLVLVGVLAICGAAVLGGLALQARIAGTVDSPSMVVLAFEKAYAEASCSDFIAVTTASFRESILVPDCATFDGYARRIQDAPPAPFQVISETVDADRAEVKVWGGTDGDTEFTFSLVLDGRHWLIYDYQILPAVLRD